METAIFVFCGWIISLCIHEFGHAAVAYFGGDTSVKEKGYLTFNIFRYADPMITLVFPVIILAMGGIAFPGAAVYIDTSKLRSRLWQSAVAAAGPLGSAISAILFALPLVLLPPLSGELEWLRGALAFLTGLVIFSIYFNLIPVPPFDGYGIIAPWLPKSIRGAFDALASIGFWLVVAAMMFIPGISTVMLGIAVLLLALIGIPPELFFQGAKRFSDNTWTIAIILITALVLLSRMRKSPPAEPQRSDSGAQ